MGFLSRLVDDVLDAGEKIVRSPARLPCAMWGHTWRTRRNGTRVCSLCAKEERQPVTHDYSGTARRWGHDVSITKVIDGGQQLRAAGWGHGIEAGDFLILDQGKSNTTRYRVKDIEYQLDPADMWFATLDFAPRAPR